MKEEGLKVNASTIMNYMNAPIMESFGGTKETISRFIINLYHNGKFYFDKPIEISGETIYKLTRISNKGDLVPIGSNPGLAEKLTGTLTRKNSKGLVISQIKATTRNMVAKIISIGLTITGRGCNSKLDILEVVDSIVAKGKNYCWEQYVVDLVKTIFTKCQ